MSRSERFQGWLGAQDAWWRWLAYAVATTIVWIFAMMLAFTIVASLVWQTIPRVIVSGSMEPALSTGDVVLTGHDEPKIGSIITYESSNGLVTHRIVKFEDQGYVTRGDANQVDDSTLVTKDHVVGVAKSVVPFLGWPRAALAQGNYLGLGLWSLIIGVSAWIAWNWRFLDNATSEPSTNKSSGDNRPYLAPTTFAPPTTPPVELYQAEQINA